MAVFEADWCVPEIAVRGSRINRNMRRGHAISQGVPECGWPDHKDTDSDDDQNQDNKRPSKPSARRALRCVSVPAPGWALWNRVCP
jgi:hypothetical protein